MTPQESVQIILVEPQNPINVGNVMRAMKNMGFDQLSTIRPADFDWSKTQISAHRTQDVLDKVRKLDSLDKALENHHIAFGFTARERAQHWESVDLPDACRIIKDQIAKGRRIALLFGREQTGLNNEELLRCDYKVRIPTSPYASLNLSQAVLLACYELAKHLPSSLNAPEKSPKEKETLASIDEYERLMTNISQTLVDIAYFKSQSPNAVLQKIKNILRRAQLSKGEIALLHGVFGEIRNYAALLQRGIIPQKIAHHFPNDRKKNEKKEGR